MTLPRDIFTGKMPAVYNSILSREGVLIPMQQDMAGNVLAHNPDGSTLAGTPTPGVDFTPSGQIPRVAGGSPVATFDSSADRVDFDIPGGDPFQMSDGGTWVVCFTPGALSTYVVPMQKTSSGTITRNGYVMYVTPAGGLAAIFSNASGTQSQLISPAGTVAAGERLLLICTHDGDRVNIYKNASLVVTATGMELPSNVAARVFIGTNVAKTYSTKGTVDFAATFPGVILDALENKNIAAQCGPLG